MEWAGIRPPFWRLTVHGLLAFLGFPFPYRRHRVLRRERDNEILGICTVLPFDSFQSWRAEITLGGYKCQMRHEHLPARKRIFYNGDKITVFDESEELVTAVVDKTDHQRGTITVVRAGGEVEAALAFLFMEARELERDSSD